MSTGQPASSRLDAYFHDSDPDSFPVPREATFERVQVADAVVRTRDWLLSQQHADGHWVGELEGDTILESEYILLLAFVGQGQSDRAKEAAAYLLQQQNRDGGWSAFPGGPTEISGSAKAYLALKITGHDPQSEPMTRARQAILLAGGVEQVNSFTRYYFAMLGLIPYDLCPAVPPELILLPRWAPFNIYEMSAWSRTIIVPLSLLWAFRPCTQLPPELGIQELFLNPQRGFSRTIRGVNHDDERGLIPWSRVFSMVDRGVKLCESLGLKPLRKRAIRLCEQWILGRLVDSDGLGAIFPPIVWTIIGLKSMGYADDSPVIRDQWNELDKLTIRENGAARLQPCLSPVWDTAIATIALRDSGLPRQHPAIRKSVEWLLSKEVRTPGDWSLAHPQVEPGGWFFEYRNEFYPDVDDTCMVLIALGRCLPNGLGREWKLELRADRGPTPPSTSPMQGILSGRSATADAAINELQAAEGLVDAVRRGVQWLVAMQSKDGGWGAFDADNTRELFTKVPFADHNAMIDPSTADISARVLESFAGLGMKADELLVKRAMKFIFDDQESDGAWFGRWGVNYIYGTWQVVVGLVAMGVPMNDPRIRRGVAWLKAKQQSCGGWGESARSYDDPTLRGIGEPTASQTAWALLGLIAAGEANSPEARRGVDYLLATQKPDGTWDEAPFTGTGFPRVFYLRYHLYRIYFPLMALARFDAALPTGATKSA